MMRVMSTPTITVYGIANCDTVKKARAWLGERAIAYTFHDFKKQGLDAGLLAQWLDRADWQQLLNRRGTTWRRLDAAEQAGACDAASAASLMLRHPSLVKRPVVDWGGALTVGFAPDDWNQRAG